MNTGRSPKRWAGIATTMSGMAILAGVALAQPAAATEIPWGQANFYTGANFTGVVYPIPATDTECTNLPEPMHSVANFKYANVEVYAGEDCTIPTGNVTGLHWGTLGVPAKSYKVLVSWPPAGY